MKLKKYQYYQKNITLNEVLEVLKLLKLILNKAKYKYLIKTKSNRILGNIMLYRYYHNNTDDYIFY